MENGFNELEKLAQQPEVFAPNGPFEKPDVITTPGEFYTSVEEIMPELAATDPSVAGEIEDSTGKAYPVGRRDFMRLFSVATMAATASCIKRPVEKAIPYATQPIDQVPGVPTYYATTCNLCPAACGVVVKTREGRPVKLEGNATHPVNQGGLCGMGQAAIQGLYHPERYQSPMIRMNKSNEQVSWNDAYKHLGEKLSKTSKVGILTNGATGSRNEFYKEFLKTLGAPETNLYTWEPNGLYAAIAEAHKIAFGLHSLPRTELRKARKIVGIGTDFLDVGVSPIYFAKSFAFVHGYANGGAKGHFTQFETDLTLTGGKADERFPITPGSEVSIALSLLKALLGKANVKGSAVAKERAKAILDKSLAIAEASSVDVKPEVFEKLADQLLAESSVVLAGGSGNFDQNSTTLQLVTVMINSLIGAYGNTLVLDRGWMNSPVTSNDAERFLTEAASLDVLIVVDSNPVFTMPKSWGIEELLKKIPTVVSIQSFRSETDEFAQYVLPSHHYLESWGDAEPVAGFYSIRQPAVRPLTLSQQAEDMFLWLAANAGKPMPYQDYRTYLEKSWKKILELVETKVEFSVFYKGLLRRGHIGKLPQRAVPEIADFSASFQPVPVQPGLKLLAPFDHRFHDGRMAHIPLLQEIGHGMTTIAWDSWLAINPNTAKKLGIKRNDVVSIQSSAGKLEVAVFPVPGLHPEALVIPRGNGHKKGLSKVLDGDAGNGIGVDPLTLFSKAADSYTKQPATSIEVVTLTATGKVYRIAAMQKHHDLDNRPEIVKTYTIAEMAKRESGTKIDLDAVPDLYPKLEEAQHRWGMTIDLDRCTGCGACMAACALENNVAQVGKDQVRMGREMHWIRLDRYFSGPVDNPGVTFQPVMCQHCNHAPCEAVCPVYATTHDAEGMNAMTYNRCVGTRYCANACPYKVRRFNWWTHKWGTVGDDQRHNNLRALNPDVTVRTRGVMEKCSFCVGRLRDAKLAAKDQNREVRDGEAKTACQQTCPSDAIIFGNLKDPASAANQARADARAYLMLGGNPELKHFGIKTLPNVSYLAVVKHDGQEQGKQHS